MKTIIFLILLSTLISCSAESDPEPVMMEAAKLDTAITSGSGCGDVVQTNNHSNGVPISIKATLKGCHATVVFMAELRGASGSKYRKPSVCDVTEQTFSFASKGQTVHLGLFVCGGDPAAGGKPYTIDIIQDGVTTTLNGKVGNTIQYVVK
jgi:hypothetical protein